MNLVYECKNGVKLTYREPNAIELYELWGISEFGDMDVNGNIIVSRLLKEAVNYFVSSSDKRTWEQIIRDTSLMDDLRNFAFELIRTRVEETEKKS